MTKGIAPLKIAVTDSTMNRIIASGKACHGLEVFVEKTGVSLRSLAF